MLSTFTVAPFTNKCRPHFSSGDECKLLYRLRLGTDLVLTLVSNVIGRPFLKNENC